MRARVAVGIGVDRRVRANVRRKRDVDVGDVVRQAIPTELLGKERLDQMGGRPSRPVNPRACVYEISVCTGRTGSESGSGNERTR